MSVNVILFFVLAILAIASALITVSSKNPVKSAMALVFHFFMLSGIYLTLNAQFIAAIQVLVYAGAIMVLVIFVIMLLNLGDEEKLEDKFNFKKTFAVLFAFGFIILMATSLIGYKFGTQFPDEVAAKNGTVQALGQTLYGNYLFGVEAIAILLTATIVGAIVLAKRKLN